MCLKKKTIHFFYISQYEAWGLPEVGDLQRSSEVLDPSLESQSAVGATQVVIKHGRVGPTLTEAKSTPTG